ncbi:LysR family transcriptional regulator, partial [Acinetobacter baumannii]
MRKLPDLDQITSFLTVAEELNFRKAAERLGLDQSAVSRRVKDLETRLGFQLL